MAKEDELELDVKPTKSGGKGKVIMILAAAILLISGSTIGLLYFMGMLGNTGGAKSADKNASHKLAAVKPSYYLSLQPPFTVNFEDQSHASYLQVEMQVMAHNQKALDVIKENMPLVRNNILLILSAQKFEQVSTRAGKEQLQRSILDAIQKVVDQSEQEQVSKDKKDEKAAGTHAPKTDKVAQVYFTSFIMQ